MLENALDLLKDPRIVEGYQPAIKDVGEKRLERGPRRMREQPGTAEAKTSKTQKPTWGMPRSVGQTLKKSHGSK